MGTVPILILTNLLLKKPRYLRNKPDKYIIFTEKYLNESI